MSRRRRSKQWVRRLQLAPSATGLPLSVRQRLFCALGALLLALATLVEIVTSAFTIERKITIP